EFISKKYNITVEEILSKKRTKTIAFPRQVAMYLAREMTDLSLPKLGEEFGGRDHTTVIHGHKKIVTEMNKDQNVASEMATFKEEIKIASKKVVDKHGFTNNIKHMLITSRR